jgi:hypothetical protein
LYKDRGGYTVDWTHEREWRCKPRKHSLLHISWTIDGVPISLPDDLYDFDRREIREFPEFRLLVRFKTEADDLKKWIGELPPYKGEDKWLNFYFNKLPKARIISFEEVENHLNLKEEDWGRIETIPLE